MGSYRFSFDPRHLLALVALTWLASFAHEFTHHATAAWACGRVGRMSLSVFAVAEPCARWPWSTLAGPSLSFALMWWGMAMVLRTRHAGWGIALVIANKPILRLVTAIGGGGDEGVLWRLVSRAHGRWLATASVFLLCLPPLVAVWRALQPKRRGLVFLGALMLPLLPILPVPFLDRRLYGGWIEGVDMLPAGFGVPWSVWSVEIGIALALVLAGLAMRRRPSR